jgi:hypothetical protein
MQIALPHSLGRAEVRRRFRARAGDIAGLFPGGLAQVTQVWRDEDHLDLAVHAMGQALSGTIEIRDTSVVVSVELPAALGFVGRMIESTIHEKGQKLLAP